MLVKMEKGIKGGPIMQVHVLVQLVLLPSGYSYIKNKRSKNGKKEVAIKLAFVQKTIIWEKEIENILVVCGRNALKEYSGSCSVNICVNPSGPRP